MVRNGPKWSFVMQNGLFSLLPRLPLSHFTRWATLRANMSTKIIPSPDQLTVMRNLVTDGKPRKEVASAMGVSTGTFHGWIIGDDFPEVKRVYLEAKQAYASDLIEGIMDQASQPLPDNPKLASAEIQRRRLICDTMKWIACKLMPRVYGDNLQINHGGKVEHEHKLSPLAQLRALEGGDASTPPGKGARVLDVETTASTTVSEADCF